jgi:O-antigen/teichoic acid export membrane protein
MGIVKNQSIKNSLFFYIGITFGAFSTIILYPNAFNVHPEHLGLLQIIVAYSTMISAFSLLGTPKTLIRFFPRVKNKNQLISLSFLIPIIGFLFVLLLYFLFKDSFLEFIKPNTVELDELKTFALLKMNFHLVFFLIVFISFFEVLSSLSYSLLDTTFPIFLKEVFLKGMNVLLLFLHWFNYLDFTTFLNLYIALYLVMIIFISVSIFRKYTYRLTFNFNEIQSKELLVYGLYVLTGGASAILVSKVDMVMIGKLIGYKEVAFYTVAYFIGNVVRVPARAIGSICMPLVARAWKKDDLVAIKDIYVKSAINQLILGGLIFLGVWLNIDDALSLFPVKFQGGRLVVFFIAFSQLFNVSTGVNGLIIANSKYYRFDLYSNFMLLCFTLFTNYIFIPSTSPLASYDIVGINGAAFATLLSVFFFNTIKMIFIYWKMRIQPFSIKTFYTVFLLSIIYYLSFYIPVTENVYFNFLWRSFCVLLLFIPAMYLLNLSKDINQAILEITNKIFK